MKISKLIKIRKTLGNHSQEKIPTPLAYKIMKFIKASDEEGAFYGEKFREIVNKYAEKDNEGKPIFEGDNIKIIKETAEDCKKEIYDLENTEVDVPKITFTIKELAPITFSISEMFILDELIKEE